jgi:hypothetical protein
MLISTIRKGAVASPYEAIDAIIEVLRARAETAHDNSTWEDGEARASEWTKEANLLIEAADKLREAQEAVSAAHRASDDNAYGRLYKKGVWA